MSTNKKILVSVLIILSLISGLSNTSANISGERVSYTFLIKHLLWLILGWVVFIYFSRKRLSFYEISIGIYLGGIVLLILVLIIGRKVGGSQRWFNLVIFSFQPSELMKWSAIVLLAFWWHRYFENASIFRTSLNIFLEEFFIPLILILIPSGLIFIQPDLGTSLFFIFLFVCLYLSLPFKKRYVIYMLVIGIILSPLVYPHLKEYQKKRLVAFIDSSVDPLGVGYSITQAKIAIGSGGIWGKGFLKGTQGKFKFLPERRTDFIFSVYAEEWGFMGVVFLLFLYFTLLLCILSFKNEGITYFDKIYCLGIYFYFLLHISINLLMCMGSLPVVGLPLPFLSYGGTHTLLEFFMLSTLFSITKK